MRVMKMRLTDPKQWRGFSLVELLLAVALLTIILGIVMNGMVQMQRRNSNEGLKVDTVQETRDFVDQMVRDVHNVGYPPSLLKTGNPTCVGNKDVSCGLVSFSSTQIVYEGDLDGTGTVYRVWVQLSAPASGKCPCILQRGVVKKEDFLASGTLPTYFTEVNGVLNSGNGAGAATYSISLPGSGSYTSYGTADVFVAYDVNAGLVAACGLPKDCSSIRSLQITANVTPNYMDYTTKTYPVFSITSRAMLHNTTNSN